MMSTGKARRRRMIPALIGIAMFSFSALQLRAQSAATESKTAAQSTGAITGRIVSQSGEKISGAVVWAFPVGVIAQSRGTSVDSNGDFKLEGLDAGVYSVSCSLPGFVPAPQPPPDDARRYHHTGDSVTMALIKGGVITGTVTTATNTPVVAAAVRAYRVRDANGQPDPGVSQPRERPTDDRGVYRFYGLPPGTYVVSVGGAGRFYGGINAGPYDNDAPTYAPSATRDTAMEIVVGSGEEITADIQYRGEPGQAISGTLAGLTQTSSQIMGALGTATGTVTLTDVRSRTLLMVAPSSALTNYSFAFYGVSDGEYEIVAQQYLQTRETLMSTPRRVIVRGADVTGINLSLTPLAAIAGRIVLESNPPADCVKRRTTASQETVINARRLKPETKPVGETAKAEPTAEIPLAFANQAAADGVPNARGDFILRNLQTGSYRFDSQLPGAGWYLKSITLGPQTIPKKASDSNIPRDGIMLKSGERVSGLTVTIAEGAASFRGRVTVAEGQSLPPNLRVYLVPAEKESAADVLRFFETRPDTDGNFAMGNIAPGHYWMTARVADESESAPVKPIRQDSALRSQVAKEAEKTRNEIQLQPCQRIVDYELRYPPAANDNKPKT